MAIFSSFLKQSRTALFVEFLALSVFIAWGDIVTGYEVSFGIFYTLPLIFTVWYCGRWPGFFLSLVIAFMRHWVDIITRHPYSHHWIHVWNESMRFAYMLLIWHGAAVVRSQLESERRQVKNLQGILPICTSCKRIRGKDGYWTEIDSYLRMNSLGEPSAKLCPECSMRYFANQEMRPAAG